MTQSGSMRTQAQNQNHRILGKFGFCHQWRCTIQRRWTWLLYNPDSFFSAESRSVYQQTVQDRNSCTEHLWADRSQSRFLHWDTDCSRSSRCYMWRQWYMERWEPYVQKFIKIQIIVSFHHYDLFFKCNIKIIKLASRLPLNSPAISHTRRVFLYFIEPSLFNVILRLPGEITEWEIISKISKARVLGVNCILSCKSQ